MALKQCMTRWSISVCANAEMKVCLNVFEKCIFFVIYIYMCVCVMNMLYHLSLCFCPGLPWQSSSLSTIANVFAPSMDVLLPLPNLRSSCVQAPLCVEFVDGLMEISVHPHQLQDMLETPLLTNMMEKSLVVCVWAVFLLVIFQLLLPLRLWVSCPYCFTSLVCVGSHILWWFGGVVAAGEGPEEASPASVEANF